MSTDKIITGASHYFIPAARSEFRIPSTRLSAFSSAVTERTDPPSVSRTRAISVWGGKTACPHWANMVLNLVITREVIFQPVQNVGFFSRPTPAFTELTGMWWECTLIRKSGGELWRKPAQTRRAYGPVTSARDVGFSSCSQVTWLRDASFYDSFFFYPPWLNISVLKQTNEWRNVFLWGFVKKFPHFKKE